jgi:drug/metabolite transporter (DMT)-like permease
MTPGSVMTAITCRSPPPWGHRLKSTANTRLSRAIQLIGVLQAVDAHSSLALALLTTLGRATMPARSRALGANTPWWLIRGSPRFRTLVVAAFSCVGVSIVVLGGLGTGKLLGDGVALAMTLGNALYITLIRMFRDTPVVWAGGLSAIQLFIVSWFVVNPLAVSQHDVGFLVLFGVSFAVAVVLWTEGTRMILAAESSLFGSAETPFAILLAWWLLSELPPLASFVGGGIVKALQALFWRCFQASVSRRLRLLSFGLIGLQTTAAALQQ